MLLTSQLNSRWSHCLSLGSYHYSLCAFSKLLGMLSNSLIVWASSRARLSHRCPAVVEQAHCRSICRNACDFKAIRYLYTYILYTHSYLYTLYTFSRRKFLSMSYWPWTVLWLHQVFISPPVHGCQTEAVHFSGSLLRSLSSCYDPLYVSCYKWQSHFTPQCSGLLKYFSCCPAGLTVTAQA